MTDDSLPGLHVMFLVDRSYLLVVTGCDDTEDPDFEMDYVVAKFKHL